MTDTHSNIQLPLIVAGAPSAERPDPAWCADWPARPYTPYWQPWRQLLAAVLLQACLDAYHGDRGARWWLRSRTARDYAAWLDLAHWPPRLDQLASRRELRRRLE